MQKLKLKTFFKIAVNIFIILIFSTVIFAQKTDNNNSVDKQQSSKTTEDLIHLGDLINVDIIGSTEFDWRGGITPEGFLDGLNFTEEPIYALCRSEEEVAAAVAKEFEKMLREPQVSVKIIDRSRRPTSLLYGAVKTPQRFQIRRQIRLNELLILAGGMTDKASGEIQILRSPNLSCAAQNETAKSNQIDNSQSTTIPAKQVLDSPYINIKISDLLKGQAESNPFVLLGDVVTVLESKPIYITGGVSNPRSIEARSNINVSRAIAAVGGLAKDADPKKVTILRFENGETKSIEVNYEKIKSGQSEDFELKAFDIVEVAQKGGRQNRYAPISAIDEKSKTNFQNLPLRIVE